MIHARGTQVIKGIEYVFETMATWNGEKKYGTHKRVYIGKMVNGAFVPNKRYTLQSQLEQAEKEKPGPVPVTTSTRLFSGTTYLLDTIGSKLGITDDLKTCFPDTWKQILSIAYYLVLEDTSPLSRFPRAGRQATGILQEQTSYHSAPANRKLFINWREIILKWFPRFIKNKISGCNIHPYGIFCISSY